MNGYRSFVLCHRVKGKLPLGRQLREPVTRRHAPLHGCVAARLHGCPAARGTTAPSNNCYYAAAASCGQLFLCGHFYSSCSGSGSGGFLTAGNRREGNDLQPANRSPSSASSLRTCGRHVASQQCSQQSPCSSHCYDLFAIYYSFFSQYFYQSTICLPKILADVLQLLPLLSELQFVDRTFYLRFNSDAPHEIHWIRKSNVFMVAKDY